MSKAAAAAAADGTPPFFSMGGHTFQVSVKDVFVRNRSKLMDQLTALKTGSSDKINSNFVVFLKGGEATTRFDSDHEPIFRQESYFWWVSGVKEPDCSLAISVATRSTTLFVPRLPAHYATIMGKIRTLEEFKELYQVDDVKYTDQVEETLLELLLKSKKSASKSTSITTNGTTAAALTNGASTSPKPAPKLLLIRGKNSDSGTMYEPPSLVFPKEQQQNIEIDTETLFPILAECRVIKSPAELRLLQHVTELTSFGHAYVMRNWQPENYEYQGESLFRHYCYYNYGSRLVGYTPICGCGPSAAVLHYGHAGEPNAQRATATDICLFDLGAEYFGYGSDVTCSFPSGGKFSKQQKVIYQAVLNAQIAVYEMMKPGVSWVDCHKAAEAAILTALAAAGIVNVGNDNKSIDELVEMRLGAVFMPHGLGHLIGIDTHDVGGYLPGHPPRSELPGLSSLRTARILQANMVLTVEPGCYFIDHLLDSALAPDSPLKRYLNADVIQAYRGFGGVRLEDVVQVVTEGGDDDEGIINYTLCPRTMAEVEETMAGGKWPPVTDTAPELRRLRLTSSSTPLPSPPSL